MFEQLSKPLKIDVMQISLLDVDCLNFMQNVAASKCDKLIIHCFWIKTYLWMNKYNIVVTIFSFDFEGEMGCLVPLRVHERECA
jgi:hypothetical protein